MKKLLLLYILILILSGVIATSVNQKVIATVVPGKINIYSPINGEIYNKKQILINLSTEGRSSSIKYSIDDKEFKTLCKNCYTYSGIKFFGEGSHILKIKAIFPTGEVFSYVNFTIDTQNPIIYKTSPVRGFYKGVFEIWFKEKNPKSLFINYGNKKLSYKSKELNLSECKKSLSLANGEIRKCSIELNISEINNQEIEYWLVLNDIAGNNISSKNKIISVDNQKPIINNFTYKINGKKVEFYLNINEKNFLEIKIFDYNEPNKKPEKLCTYLKNNVCKTNKTYKKGFHNITISIYDKAGNIEEIKGIIFNVS